MNPILLNVKQTAEYLNIKETKTRELFKQHEKVFVIHIGNRLYAHKDYLDRWLKGQVGLGA